MNYKDLDYKSYKDYLEGKEWSEIHEFFYQNCGEYKCRLCSKTKDLLLHKRSYRFLSMKLLRRHFFYIKILVVRYLIKYMVWLCEDCNNLVHFYDDGIPVPLQYKLLWMREEEIRKRKRRFWQKILQTRPSDILEYIGEFLSSYSPD